jgi:hypothetical protein
MMEKRWSERKLLQVDVDVYQQGELLGSCVSSDIGLGGTFLARECSLEKASEANVELVFRLASQGQSTKHKINARIARTSDAGFGLKFCDFDTGVFRSLQEIMSYKKNSSAEDIVSHTGTH